MNKLTELKPQPLFSYFEEICRVPRPSKKEEKIRKFLLDFAGRHKLHSKTDKAGNVLISKPAMPGKEGASTVILQTHMDMVCEKNSNIDFDFENDSIEPIITDGWVKANGTTLGADCGIGIAAQLAVLASRDIQHGPLECLITVDEETGLTGAFALQPGFMSGSILLNLDSEDEGELFIGCAGGIDTNATFQYLPEPTPEHSVAFHLAASGFLGGHSGDDIHKKRGNAIKVLNRFLWKLSREYDARIARFDGGNLRNAIPREASAIITVPASHKNAVWNDFNTFQTTLMREFENNEPGCTLQFAETDLPKQVIDRETGRKLLNVLYAAPHGVLEMSTRVEGMVETSTNLASIRTATDGKETVFIATSQRSELESRKYDAAAMVRSLFELAGADVTQSDGYPGWTPNPDSDILKKTVASYQRLFGKPPLVRSIHAGLECGLFLEKYPHLDMVSFGPTIRGAHSPDERLDIASTGKFWKHLVDLLEW